MIGRISIRARLAIGILAALAVVLAVMVPVQLGRLSDTIDEAERRELTAAYNTLDATIALRALAGHELATLVANQPEAKEAFANRDRDRLIRMFHPAFAALHGGGTVDQFQFHTPASGSFLRLHMPDRWGDDLSSFRHTVNEANSRLEPVSGLEHGVAGLGIRSVVPMFDPKGVHIGTVEFGMNVSQALTGEFKERFGHDLVIHTPGRDGVVEVAASSSSDISAAGPGQLSGALAGEVLLEVGDGEAAAVRLFGPLRDFAGHPVAVAEIVMDHSPYAVWYRGTVMVSVLLGLAALGGGAALSWGLARGVAGPLVRVAKVIRMLGAGNLLAEVPHTGRHDEIGDLARAAEVFRRKSLEADKLLKLEEEMAAIVRGSHDAIIGMAADGTITTWNRGAEETFGRSADEMLGTSVTSLFPPGQHGEIARLIEAAGLGSIVHRHETEGLTKDGQRISLWLTMAPKIGADGSVAGISAICRDFTDRKLAEQALAKVTRAMRTLSGGNQTLVHSADEPALVKAMCEVAVKVGGYPQAWVAYLGADANLEIQAWSTRDGSLPRVSHCLAQAGRNCPVYRAIADRAPLMVDDANRSAFTYCGGRTLNCEGRALLALPLSVGGGAPLGVLVIHSDDTPAFDTEEMRLLRELAGDLAFGVVTLRMQAAKNLADGRLERALERTIQAVAATIEVRDPYTAGHQRRAAEIAVAIARAMELPEDRVKGVYVAGLIHDIGKISIPSEVLTRPGKLSPIEFELIKTHTQTGYEIVRDIEFPWPVADSVLQHHERLDGSGYPNGLTGEEITLEARILAVADVIDAMSSHRPYRASLGLAAALDELGLGRGSKYDAMVVDAVLGNEDVLGVARGDCAPSQTCVVAN